MLNFHQSWSLFRMFNFNQSWSFFQMLNFHQSWSLFQMFNFHQSQSLFQMFNFHHWIMIIVSNVQLQPIMIHHSEKNDLSYIQPNQKFLQLSQYHICVNEWKVLRWCILYAYINTWVRLWSLPVCCCSNSRPKIQAGPWGGWDNELPEGGSWRLRCVRD